MSLVFGHLGLKLDISKVSEVCFKHYCYTCYETYITESIQIHLNVMQKSFQFSSGFYSCYLYDARYWSWTCRELKQQIRRQTKYYPWHPSKHSPLKVALGAPRPRHTADSQIHDVTMMSTTGIPGYPSYISQADPVDPLTCVFRLIFPWQVPVSGIHCRIFNTTVYSYKT